MNEVPLYEVKRSLPKAFHAQGSIDWFNSLSYGHQQIIMHGNALGLCASERNRLIQSFLSRVLDIRGSAQGSLQDQYEKAWEARAGFYPWLGLELIRLRLHR